MYNGYKSLTVLAFGCSSQNTQYMFIDEFCLSPLIKIYKNCIYGGQTACNFLNTQLFYIIINY